MITPINHPWQTGPTELIQYAIKHLHNNNDFDNRIAYLLFDIGVETLLKTYLTLPEEVTNTHIKFSERQRAAEGNFHELIRGVSDSASDKLKNIDLAHLHYYHNLRNKLYHEGNGITIPQEKLNSYAELATNLLKALLDIDLEDELRKPEIVAQERAKILELHNIFEEKQKSLRKKAQKLEDNLLLILEKIAPKFTLPSFSNKFSEITNKYLVKYVYDIDENGNAYFAYRLTTKDELIHVYHREIIELIESLIDDFKLKDVLLKLETFNLSKKITIETILFPTLLSGCPEAKDIQLRVLELVVPEFIRWRPIINQIGVPSYILDNPSTGELEALNMAILDYDNLELEIDRIIEEILKWLKIY